ncbi:MAG: N-acetyltransferase [Anaerolineaceae bacterium]|nr:N-acetyltransferase [Anaerolineaceae bacterium]
MEKTAVSIQNATWHDLGQLRQLEQECFGEDAWPLIDLIGVLTMPGVIRFKAVADDQMVGFISGDPRSGDGIGWITTLGVRPTYRRQGIAQSLLVICEDQMGLRRVRLCVRRDNDPAITLYEQNGYRKVDIWSNYYGPGRDALVLEKERLTFK